MTRYARANGSRGNNSKQENPSTSWILLKNHHRKGDTRGKREDSGVELKTNTIRLPPSDTNSSDLWFEFCGGRKNESVAKDKETRLGNCIKQRCGKIVIKRERACDIPPSLQEEIKSFGRGISNVAKEASVSSGIVNISGRSGLSKISSAALDMGISRRARGCKTGITRNEQKELRRKEKAHKREKKKVCFCCRRWGHQLADCPEFRPLSSMREITLPAGGFCYNCGSTEHKVDQCTKRGTNDLKFARCFVCGEKGHLARQCIDNPKGAYPQGGKCRICGKTTHLCSNCPNATRKCYDPESKVLCMTKGPVDSLPGDFSNHSSNPVTFNRIIQF